MRTFGVIEAFNVGKNKANRTSSIEWNERRFNSSFFHILKSFGNGVIPRITWFLKVSGQSDDPL